MDGSSLEVESEGSSFVVVVVVESSRLALETETEAMAWLVVNSSLCTIVCQGLQGFTRRPQRFRICSGVRCDDS